MDYLLRIALWFVTTVRIRKLWNRIALWFVTTVRTRKLWNRIALWFVTTMRTSFTSNFKITYKVKKSVRTAEFLCLTYKWLFKIKTWVVRSFSYHRDFWFSLYSNCSKLSSIHSALKAKLETKNKCSDWRFKGTVSYSLQVLFKPQQNNKKQGIPVFFSKKC